MSFCQFVVSGLIMNITSPNGNLTESSLQGAYARQTQAASEIAASESNKPQQVNASAEVALAQKDGAKKTFNEQFTLPSAEFPVEVPINVPVSSALTCALANELNQYPDIDHDKVANVMTLLNNGKLAVSSEDLAADMMNFYQSGR